MKPKQIIQRTLVWVAPFFLHFRTVKLQGIAHFTRSVKSQTNRVSAVVVHGCPVGASTFGKPVQVEVTNLSQRLVWDFKEGDEVDAVSGTLRQHGLSLESRADGILYLN